MKGFLHNMISQKQFVKGLTAAILLGLLIFFSNVGVVRTIRGGILFIFRPLMNLAEGLKSRSPQISKEFLPELINENQRLKAMVFDKERLEAENLILKKALGIKESIAPKMISARVLLHTQEFARELLIIDQGEQSGVAKGDLVVDANRLLVGVVAESESNISKVALATSPGQSFEAEILPLKIRVLAKGLGSRTFSLELIPSDAQIRKGDFVALAGRTSLLVGEVISSRSVAGGVFQEARATLISRPEILGFVFIITSP